MDIIELTRELGAAIQNTEEYKRFMAAKEKNDNDEQLQKQIGDFNLLKMQLDAEYEKEEKDEAKLLQINEEIVALYNVIIDKISNILLMCENGEDPKTCEPSSCTGNCSSCGGCH